ncbi:hypothetical protein D3C75_907090 [compost metagenome]
MPADHRLESLQDLLIPFQTADGFDNTRDNLVNGCFHSLRREVFLHKRLEKMPDAQGQIMPIPFLHRLDQVPCPVILQMNIIQNGIFHVCKRDHPLGMHNELVLHGLLGAGVSIPQPAELLHRLARIDTQLRRVPAGQTLLQLTGKLPWGAEALRIIDIRGNEAISPVVLIYGWMLQTRVEDGLKRFLNVLFKLFLRQSGSLIPGGYIVDFHQNIRKLLHPRIRPIPVPGLNGRPA